MIDSIYEHVVLHMICTFLLLSLAFTNCGRLLRAEKQIETIWGWKTPSAVKVCDWNLETHNFTLDRYNETKEKIVLFALLKQLSYRIKWSDSYQFI